MIPLSLITGFLGSGKTSLLQHIVETNPHRRFVYMVND
ncbi:MAG: GTP-binding protein, partial [Phycisphaerae bacterium]